MYKLLEKHKNYSLHLMVVILGLTGIFGKLISLDALSLVWYRMLIAFLSLFIFLAIKKQLFDVNKKDFWGIIGVGVLVTFHWLFFFEAIKVSTVSVAVVCLATSSLFSALIEPIFFKRKILFYEVILGVIVLGSLAYVLGTDSKYILGYFYGIMAALFGTVFTLFNAKYIKKVDAAKITMIEMLTGVIIVSLIFVFQGNYSIFNNTISLPDFSYLIILGIVCTALVFVWMTEIMRHISPYSLIMAINLEPIYSIILALIIFGDSELMSTSFYIGSAIIIGVVFLDGYLKNKQ
ncbi:MAG: DMT family transporter [Flavobacteriales bacterium]|nr:DMT family transporter [Flavobacteriales bacterium]